MITKDTTTGIEFVPEDREEEVHLKWFRSLFNGPITQVKDTLTMKDKQQKLA